MKGLFITFEGPDGAGKTTQIKKLNEYFLAQGRKVALTREPGGTKIAEAIRNILLDAGNMGMDNRTELLLYAAARAQHVSELIKPAIEVGEVVICDRFYDSTFAYQGFGRNLDEQLIEQLNTIATEGLQPHLTILLDIDARIGLERVQNSRGKAFDRLESEQLEFHQRVRQGFLTLAERFPKRIKTISGEQTPEDIFTHIIGYINEIKS